MNVTTKLAAQVEVLRELLREQEHLRKSAEDLAERVRQAEEKARLADKQKLLIEKALHLIVEAGDTVAEDSYRFITRSINGLLEKMFTDCARSVRLTQKTIGKNPTIAVEVVADGVSRDLSESSGHGISQIVSLICIICLIVLNDTRRIVVLDEVLSGISEQNKEALNETLWAFTDIGFQFILCEHNFIPSGARVFHLVNTNGVSTIDRIYTQGSDAV